MGAYGLMVDYEYCTGCHSCEVACKNEHDLPLDLWGIKLTEVGPWQIDERKWEWIYIPVPTSLCDMCEGRIEKGRKPACVHHCQAKVLEFGTVEELAKKVEQKGGKAAMFLP